MAITLPIWVSLQCRQQLIKALEANGQAALAASLKGQANVDVLVTHHGSRELGAQVYKRGIEAAIAHTQRVSPDTPAHQAWLDPETETGAKYWDALQYVARWTRRNHQLVHERTLARLGINKLADFGNEHNFVWQRDGLYYHGKGATPAWTRRRPTIRCSGLIPLNMAAPILLTLGRNNQRLCVVLAAWRWPQQITHGAVERARDSRPCRRGVPDQIARRS